MNTAIPDVPDSDDLIAAEFVLGLLDAGARRDAETRLRHDAAFAAHVASWDAYFSPWLEDIAPVEVPGVLWTRIRTTLWQHELPERAQAAASTASSTSLWNRLAFWRALAGGGFALAAASIAALVLTLNTPPPAPVPAPPVVAAVPPAAPMVVSLRHDDGTMAYTATVDAETGVITLIPAFMPDDSRVPELWLIPADGKPRSLGVVARDHAQRVLIPAAIRRDAAAKTVFAVSMEPSGGSPTGLPTGPVVAKGSLIQL